MALFLVKWHLHSSDFFHLPSAIYTSEGSNRWDHILTHCNSVGRVLDYLRAHRAEEELGFLGDLRRSRFTSPRARHCSNWLSQKYGRGHGYASTCLTLLQQLISGR